MVSTITAIIIRSVGRGHHACGVASVRKLRPRSTSASGGTGRKGIESDFRFWPGAEATAARHGGQFLGEHLPRVGVDHPRRLRQSDAGWAIRPLSKDVPSRQSRSSIALNDPERTWKGRPPLFCCDAQSLCDEALEPVAPEPPNENQHSEARQVLGPNPKTAATAHRLLSFASAEYRVRAFFEGRQ
jgi:hypothetical protein